MHPHWKHRYSTSVADSDSCSKSRFPTHTTGLYYSFPASNAMARCLLSKDLGSTLGRNTGKYVHPSRNHSHRFIRTISLQVVLVQFPLTLIDRWNPSHTLSLMVVHMTHHCCWHSISIAQFQDVATQIDPVHYCLQKIDPDHERISDIPSQNLNFSSMPPSIK